MFCGLTARFLSDLVGNPEDRFSHNEAHLIGDKNDHQTAFVLTENIFVLCHNHICCVVCVFSLCCKYQESYYTNQNLSVSFQKTQVEDLPMVNGFYSAFHSSKD